MSQPENGRTLYAFSSIEWGVFKEAYENRDRLVHVRTGGFVLGQVGSC